MPIKLNPECPVCTAIPDMVNDITRDWVRKTLEMLGNETPALDHVPPPIILGMMLATMGEFVRQCC